jgi:hypothetical protein
MGLAQIGEYRANRVIDLQDPSDCERQKLAVGQRTFVDSRDVVGFLDPKPSVASAQT